MITDEITEDAIRTKARALLKHMGWKPGDRPGLYSVLELLTRFGVECRKLTDRCVYPECGCDFDATCADAFEQPPAAAPPPPAEGETKPVAWMFEDLILTSAQPSLTTDPEIAERRKARPDEWRVTPLCAAPPSAEAWKPDREAVARMINPEAWVILDQCGGDMEHPYLDQKIITKAQIAHSLATADRILALSTPAKGGE